MVKKGPKWDKNEGFFSIFQKTLSLVFAGSDLKHFVRDAVLLMVAYARENVGLQNLKFHVNEEE